MAEIRVTGGELRGRRHYVPKSGIRPTTGRVREAAFSILGDVSGTTVLDLFCGSGALGIEAISRGASQATLVDTNPRAARANIEALDLTHRARTVRADASRFLKRAERESFDLVLCDPPYRLADRLANELDPLIRAVLAEGGRVLVETSPASPLPLSLPLLTERGYGDTLIRVHSGAGDRG
jgi:16S rRNA (guanine966-N2)-methyltransferase